MKAFNLLREGVRCPGPLLQEKSVSGERTKMTRETPACCSMSRRDIVQENDNITEELDSKDNCLSSGKAESVNQQIYIPGGSFFMGTKDKEGYKEDGEGPVRKVTVDPFYMDAHTVTNAEFQEFVQEQIQSNMVGLLFFIHL